MVITPLVIIYIILALIVIARPLAIIYLLAVVSPFYEYFTELFYKIHIYSFSFTLKPFLFLTLLLILCSMKRIFSGQRKVFDDLALTHKFIFLSFSVFCLFSAFFAFIQKSQYLTEINLFLNISLIFFLPIFYWKKTIRLNYILNILTVIVFCIAAYSLFYFLLPNPVYFKMSKHPGFCTFLLLTIPFVILNYFFAKNRMMGYFALAASLCSFVAIIFSLTRSGYVALLITLPFFIYYLFSFSKASRDISRKIFIFTSSLFLCAVIAVSFSSRVRGAMLLSRSVLVASDNNIYKDPQTAQIKNYFLRNMYLVLAHERTIVWRKSLELVRASPFKGHGLNYHVVPGLMGAHNNFIAVLVASGIAGFVFFIFGSMLLLVLLLKKIKSNLNWVKKSFFLAVLISLVSLFVQGLVQTIINEYIIWFVISLSFLNQQYLVLDNKENLILEKEGA
ncbi:MAG: O-antigen ligase family protein [Candidatus Omnitrophica bacterium]|nr:O-antigen ligase family protein [Candidatus Omnitrophota bacterium]